mmetsp:Transcript_29504/g.97863  ORF Transcript_29504/g.97863 Transcript_29504/m.97863 type:complete len:258 (+) Transcript_29504:779-1552(+)
MHTYRAPDGEAARPALARVRGGGVGPLRRGWRVQPVPLVLPLRPRRARQLGRRLGLRLCDGRPSEVPRAAGHTARARRHPAGRAAAGVGELGRRLALLPHHGGGRTARLPRPPRRGGAHPHLLGPRRHGRAGRRRRAVGAARRRRRADGAAAQVGRSAALRVCWPRRNVRERAHVRHCRGRRPLGARRPPRSGAGDGGRLGQGGATARVQGRGVQAAVARPALCGLVRLAAAAAGGGGAWRALPPEDRCVMRVFMPR